MSVKIKPTSTIKARLGLDADGRVQKFLTNTCYKHMDKYVPKDEGNLRVNVDIQPTSITYVSPYAKYQYRGMREDGSRVVRHYTTPGTGTYWDKKMVSAEINDVIDEVQDYIGGRIWTMKMLEL